MPTAAAQQTSTDYLVAVASISATLVAIIGGFMISRIVVIASERNGLQQRLREATNASERARDALAERQREDDASECEMAIWRARDLLVSTNAEISAHALLQHIEDSDRDYDVDRKTLLAACEEAVAGARATYEFLHEADTNGPWSTNWPTMRGALRKAGIDFDPDIQEKIYDEVKARRERRERKAQREKAQSSSFGRFASMGIMPQSFTVPVLPNVQPFVQRVQLPLSQDALHDVVRDREAEEAVVRNALARVTTPTDLARGLWLLGLFALAGIVYPVVLLAINHTYWGPWWRYSVLGLFLLGLVGVFVYLLHLLALAKPSEHEDELADDSTSAETTA